MRLIGQPAGAGDLTERIVARQHQALCVADPLADQEIVRRFTSGDLERAAKMPVRKPRFFGQSFDRDRAGQMTLNKRERAS